MIPHHELTCYRLLSLESMNLYLIYLRIYRIGNYLISNIIDNVAVSSQWKEKSKKVRKTRFDSVAEWWQQHASSRIIIYERSTINFLSVQKELHFFVKSSSNISETVKLTVPIWFLIQIFIWTHDHYQIYIRWCVHLYEGALPFLCKQKGATIA